MQDTETCCDLVADLRFALRHLYDPNNLRRSRLTRRLGLAETPCPATALREALTSAILALRPRDDAPRETRLWRTYETLHCRYVEQLSQPEVADQLGLSVRQLRREEKAALVSLAHALARERRLALPHDLRGTDDDRDEAETDLRTMAIAESTESLLQRTGAQKTADLRSEVSTVMELVRSLAEQHGVPIQASLGSAPEFVRASPILLRQALVSMLSIAIHHCGNAGVRLTTERGQDIVRITISGQAVSDPRVLSDADRANLEAARQLTEIMEGRLALDCSRERVAISLDLRALGTVHVLVLDDHRDTLQLLTRYVTGTHYHLVGVDDPAVALERAAALSPHIIVLDVMMPEMDGWQVLRRLKGDPRLSEARLLVCTVLPHEELARSLGADAFVAKPVTRETFLKALEHLAPLREP